MIYEGCCCFFQLPQRLQYKLQHFFFTYYYWSLWFESGYIMHRRRFIKNNNHQLFDMYTIIDADLKTLRVCLPVLGVKGDATCPGLTGKAGVDEFIHKRVILSGIYLHKPFKKIPYYYQMHLLNQRQRRK